MVKQSAPAGHIREATPDDIAALMEIETHSFHSDHLSARSFRHLLTEGNSVTLVDAVKGALRGDITLLFRSDVSLARVYSIAASQRLFADPGSGLPFVHGLSRTILAPVPQVKCSAAPVVDVRVRALQIDRHVAGACGGAGIFPGMLDNESRDAFYRVAQDVEVAFVLEPQYGAGPTGA